MTADAKVGLLLGLVFIGIIAFVINGLPDFIHSAREKPVVETAVTTQTGSNLVIEPAVVDAARNLQEKRTSVRYVQPPSDVMVPDQHAGGSDGSSATPEQLVSGNTVSSAVGAEKSSQPGSTVAVVKPQEPQPSLVNPQVDQTVQVAQQTAAQIQQQNRPDNPAAPKTLQKPVAGANHVVQDGESLAVIAKKYYGQEEGNRKSTIQMLYEANKNILESPDKIQVGDQLVIPKVKSAAAPQAVPAKKESAAGALLDKFKNVFTLADSKKNNMAVKEIFKEKDVSKNVSKDSITGDKKTEKPQSLKGVTEYTVQSGDYLYKIARKFLGDNDRYPEIAELNRDVLTNGDHLQVGMKLKIPKR